MHHLADEESQAAVRRYRTARMEAFSDGVFGIAHSAVSPLTGPGPGSARRAVRLGN